MDSDVSVDARELECGEIVAAVEKALGGLPDECVVEVVYAREKQMKDAATFAHYMGHEMVKLDKDEEGAGGRLYIKKKRK